MKFYNHHILVSIDNPSLKNEYIKIMFNLRNELKLQQLDDDINVLDTGSLGILGTGISMVIYPENITYINISVDDIPEIVKEHFIKGLHVNRLLMREETLEKTIKMSDKRRIVLEHCGMIDPENIADYLAVGGYEVWEKALTELDPLDIIDTVRDSGLRGRGGAGFPTGTKWTFTEIFKGVQKYFIINADEGEPGTCKDRLIMEGDPHKLVEGLMISSFAVGATKAIIYVRGEYKLSINRLQKAIDQAVEYGILGTDIFGSGFDLNIEIKIGAGAYVCGEETALIESIEGKRGNPRSKPPFPGVKGLWQQPTVVNNVETIANIPSIIKNGANWYRSFGTKDCPGTKVFMILGDVALPGFYEVDLGTPLRTVIEEYGGGMKDGKKFKAALIGGAAGVFIPKEFLDVNLDYKNLHEQGAVLGSGAILVMNDDVDIVEMMYSVIKFFRHESCGKCSPCRLGNEQLYQLIRKIRSGKGKEADFEKMLTISDAMQKTSFCALGQSPAMSIKSAFKYFKADFEKVM